MKYEFDLIEENISWEEIPSELDKFDMFLHNLLILPPIYNCSIRQNIPPP